MVQRPSRTWSSAVITAAFFTTFVMLIVLMEFVNFASASRESGDVAFVFLGFSVLVMVALRWTSPLAWRARFALALPLTHIFMAVVALVVWKNSTVSSLYPELVGAKLPGLGVGLIAGGVVIALALAHQQLSRRRAVPFWVRPLVVFSLIYLFILGVSLPVHATLLSSSSAGVILGFPLLPAALIAAVGGWHSSRRASGITWWIASLVVFAAAMVAAQTDEAGVAAHAAFMTPAIGVASLVMGCLLSLALTQWRELRYHRNDTERGAPWVQTGVARTGDGSPVAVFEFRGWLAGFRSRVMKHTIEGSGVPVMVPGGSSLRAPLPPASVDAEPGEVFVALANGASVIATGFETVDGSPYRGGAAVVASDAGVQVASRAEPPVTQAVALLLWRPCTLYLGVAIATMAPLLIGLLAIE